MAGNKPNLLIVGAGETAALAYDYFTEQANYNVVGFGVEQAFLKNQTLFGLPVVALEDIKQHFAPEICSAFVAVSYTQLNRLRSKLCHFTKLNGYPLTSYISPHAVIARNVEIGENCFILENVTIQRGSKIGANVTLWCGCSIGHGSVVHDNCFLASHVAVSGFCEIGAGSFLGVNSCLRDKVHVGKDCVVGAGAVLTNDTFDACIYVGNPAKPLPNKTTEPFILGKEII